MVRRISLCLTIFLVNGALIAQDTTSYYACFNGSIDKNAITINLHKAGKQYLGYYYYDSQQLPIYFSGREIETDSGTNIIEVEAFPVGAATEIFDFTITEGVANGTWKKSISEQSLPFTATINNTVNHFDYIYSRGRQRLFSSLPDGPKAEFAAATVWPKGEEETAIFLKEIVCNTFKDSSIENDIRPVFLNNRRAFFTKYKEENKTVVPEQVTEEEYKYSKDDLTEMMICWQSKNIISLAVHHYAYAGGAHGESSKLFYTYDLDKKDRLDYEDILLVGSDSAISKIIGQKLRVAYKLTDNEPLKKVEFFEENIKPSNNFYFTSRGIIFSYLPNQVAPESMGQINVFVPFSEISTLLQQSYKSLVVL